MARYIVIAPNGKEITIGMPFGEPITFYHGEYMINDYVAKMFPNVFHSVPDDFGVTAQTTVKPEPPVEKVEQPKAEEKVVEKKVTEEKPKTKKATATKKEGGKVKSKKNTFTRG